MFARRSFAPAAAAALLLVAALVGPPPAAAQPAAALSCPITADQLQNVDYTAVRASCGTTAPGDGPPCAACLCDIGRALFTGLNASGVDVATLVSGSSQEALSSLFLACQVALGAQLVSSAGLQVRTLTALLACPTDAVTPACFADLLPAPAPAPAAANATAPSNATAAPQDEEEYLPDDPALSTSAPTPAAANTTTTTTPAPAATTPAATPAAAPAAAATPLVSATSGPTDIPTTGSITVGGSSSSSGSGGSGGGARSGDAGSAGSAGGGAAPVPMAPAQGGSGSRAVGGWSLPLVGAALAALVSHMLAPCR